MKLNKLRKIIGDNINEKGPNIVVSDNETIAKVDFSLWPLQESPTIAVLLEDIDLTLNGEAGVLKTVHFTTDHIETDLEPSDFHISERDGFVKTSLEELQKHLAKEWNE